MASYGYSEQHECFQDTWKPYVHAFQMSHLLELRKNKEGKIFNLVTDI